MAINITEDIRSVSELKKDAKRIFDHVHRTRRPVVIMVRGRAGAVLVDPEEYEEMQRALELAAQLAQGEKDTCTGRVRPTRDFLAELRRGKAVPR
ncbi:MAG: type II toxin-antitoxin system Phd/YefM family antitoxin [Deltaproteobacteria bacterium]|nr:type II toxin-antitoxin system Phd/YefM family antitoxin [Deltaproteobacteria bacterium]